MKVLIVALGSSGDVHPFIGIALALKIRGHDVKIFTNENFQSLVEEFSLEFGSIGSWQDYKALTENPAVWHPWKGFSILIESVIVPSLEVVYEQLKAHIELGKTVIVASTLALGARLIQEKLNIPTVTAHLAPTAIRSEHSLPNMAGFRVPDWVPKRIKRSLWWCLDKLFIDPSLCPGLNGFRQQLGLAPLWRVGQDWIHSPDLTIGLFPPWFGRRPVDWPEQLRLTGFPLFDEVECTEPDPQIDEYLRQGEAPIVFTMGSAMGFCANFFSAAVDICRTLGRRGVLLTRFSEQIPNSLPDNIRHFDYIPLSRLLPRSAAFVHHGGIGCCAQGLRAGVPQLIQPVAFDQFDNAERLKKLGVGDWVPPRQFRTSGENRLNRLIESTAVRGRCRAIVRKLADSDSVVDICELIEECGKRVSKM